MIRFKKQPDGTPDAARLTEWKATCSRCGRRRSVEKIDDWMFGRGGCAVVHCARCTRRVARRIVEGAVGRSRPIAWLAGWARSWRGRRADRAVEDPFA